MADKVDLKKELDSFRAKRGELRIFTVPDLRYLMLDGEGDPNSAPAFTDAIETLYPIAYRLKFASKRELGRDYVVPPLEGLWWAEDMAAFTSARDKAQWLWTLMILVPDWIEEARVATAIGEARDVRLATLSEGRCVQTLHVGSFDDEAPVLEQMHHEFIPANGLRMVGRHHEVYLSDFRRVAPEKRRTILRQPVVPADSPE